MTKGTTAAPNSTTLSGEVTGVIPDAEANGTTAALNDKSLPAEAPSVIPDTDAKRSDAVTETESKAGATSTANAESGSSAPKKQEASNDPATVAATTAATVKAIEPIQELWAVAQGIGHPEIWGVTLADPSTHVPTQIVLQKYLNANDGDLAKAKDQLTKTLEWRAVMKPLDLLAKTFSRTKFDGLGYVTKYNSGENKEVFTWNIYGGVKKIDETFGDLDEFIEWRVALMELALQELDIAGAAQAINADNDPFKIFQVHDYRSISFLRSPPQVRSASKETINIFAQNYPELLKEKFFINVPAIMGFMYGIIKVFAPAKTVKKFHPMSDGGRLALEFGDSKVDRLGELLPKEYGGKGADLKDSGKETLLQ